jgi:ubiquinone biosynthesis protein COQ9
MLQRISGGVRRLSSATTRGEAELRASILAAALKHVPARGWSTDALAAGASDVGLSPSAHAIVSGGPADLVAHFQHSADQRLRERLSQLGEGETGYALSCARALLSSR